MFEQVQKVLDNLIRPSLQSHGGDCELIAVKNNKVYVRLTGGCRGCSGAKMTMRDGVGRILMREIPEVLQVIDVTDYE